MKIMILMLALLAVGCTDRQDCIKKARDQFPGRAMVVAARVANHVVIMVLLDGPAQLYSCETGWIGSADLVPLGSETFDKSGKVIGDAK